MGEPIVLTPGYHPVEEYGILGDLRTACLVGPNGSIDFLCLPRFDSPSVFCATVDDRKGGRFQILPKLSDANERRWYVPDTNILLSRFLSEDGVAEVSDYMYLSPDHSSSQALVRRAKAVHGDVHFQLLFQPRFNYARAQHKVERISKREFIFYSKGADKLALRLRSEIDLELNDGDVFVEFKLKSGEKANFVLEDAALREGSPFHNLDFCSEAFKRTANYWRKWTSVSHYRGRWRETVNRSALALKLLCSREFGSVIAAPCFGFPNEIGGERNWDYRFTWVRDASFTVYALMRLGYTETAAGFMGWLEDRISELEEGSSLNTMYCIDGSPLPGEVHLEDLNGYMNSRPVRVGSTNHDQIQLDIYGELMDSVYLYDTYGSPISFDLWNKLQLLIEFVCDNWHRPDSSIWEVRSEPREFLYSRVLCWVALERAVRLARKRSLPGAIDRWEKERDKIYRSVFKDFWSEKRKAFVQFKGSNSLDASAFIMPLVRFISPTDPRWLSTVQAIENDLVEDSRVYRYNVGEAFSDKLEGGEGTFSICSFWYIESLARSGDLQKARYLFEKILGYSNRLGLFSEQIGKRGEFLGNVPQAFTHLALISTAFYLDRSLTQSKYE